jgi:hypothetical protein
MIKDKNAVGYKIAEQLADMHKAGKTKKEIEANYADLMKGQPMWVGLAVADTFKALVGI